MKHSNTFTIRNDTRPPFSYSLLQFFIYYLPFHPNDVQLLVNIAKKLINKEKPYYCSGFYFILSELFTHHTYIESIIRTIKKFKSFLKLVGVIPVSIQTLTYYVAINTWGLTTYFSRTVNILVKPTGVKTTNDNCCYEKHIWAICSPPIRQKTHCMWVQQTGECLAWCHTYLIKRKLQCRKYKNK